MTSVQFVSWLEAKLIQTDIRKVVPDETTLVQAYRRMVRLRQVQQAMDAAMAHLPPDEAIPVPPNLVQQLHTAVEGTAQPWDEALWHLTEDHRERTR